MNSDSSLSILLYDILQGYSCIYNEDKIFYFKHYSLLEMLEFDNFREESLRNIIKSGIKPEKELIQEAINNKVWSIKQDEEIQSLEWMVSKSKESAEKISDNMQRKAFLSQIEIQEKQLDSLMLKKSNITKYSAENLCDRKKTINMFNKCLFYDLEFKNSIDQDDLNKIYKLFFDKISQFNDTNTLLKITYFTGFLDIVSLQHNNILSVLGKNYYSMTHFQKNLLNISNNLLNKIKNSNIPKDIYNDPIKIYNWKDKKTNDSEKSSEGIDDIKRKMAANGGKITAEELLS